VRAVKREEKPGPLIAALRRATRTSLFDHLVGELLKMQRHIEAERLCGLQIYHHLEFARCLHRQFSRLDTSQNAVDIGCGTSKQINKVYPVLHETTCRGVVAEWIDGRQSILGCHFENQFAVSRCHGVWHHDQAAVDLA